MGQECTEAPITVKHCFRTRTVELPGGASEERTSLTEDDRTVVLLACPCVIQLNLVVVCYKDMDRMI